MTVFAAYSQDELDRQYDQSNWSTRPPGAYGADYRALTDKAKATLGAPLEFSYGDGPKETLDVYRTDQPDAPIHVFVHGGAWRTMDKADSGFAAPLFVSRGIHFVALNFGLCPEVDLPTMVAQVRAGIAWVHRNAGRFGGNPDRLHISGHSSGAHLAACAVITDWQAEFGLDASPIRSALLCSGGYDLDAVQKSARNDYMQISDQSVEELSPTRHPERFTCPVVLAAGGRESDEFTRQSQALAEALGQPLHIAEGMDHFEVSFTLATPDGLLARHALELIGKD